MDELITAAWLDEILQQVDLNVNAYSINRRPLSREERQRVITTLLPALRERAARQQATHNPEVS